MKDVNSSYSDRLRADKTPTNDRDDEIDLVELFRVLWRGKGTMLLAAFLALMVGGYYAFGVAEPQYRASTQLTLEVRTNQVVDLETVVSGVSKEAAALNTEIEIIRSRRLLGKLVDELDLMNDPEFNSALRNPSMIAQAKSALRRAVGMVTGAAEKDEVAVSAEANEAASAARTNAQRNAIIGALRSRVDASVQSNTYVFEISLTTGDRQKSARILNTLADLYLQEQIAVKFEATETAVAWLSQRVGELEQEFRAKEQALKAARDETDLISAEALQALNLQAKDLRDRITDTRQRAQAAGAELARLESLGESGDRAAIVAATNDPTLRQLASEIAAGDEEAAALFDKRFETIIGSARVTHERLLEQSNALAESYQSLQQRIDAQSADLLRIQQMEREAEATRTLYETFLTRLKETTVQRGLQQADSRVLSDAIPGAKVAPRTSMILALSMVLGLMGGSGIVLGRQFLHNSFRTAEELEAATGLAVIGQIPEMPIKVRRDLIGYLRDKPTSAAAEAVRNLRTSLLLSNIDHPPKVIMSTSSLPDEGKTTQAVALAQNLAGLGKRVLLIEGDIRRRTLSEYFKDVPKGGIVAAMSGDVPLNEVVFHDERLQADVLMGEKSTVNAADLFSSERFATFLERARDAYDFVIIDTPPVLVVPDARVIGQHVDAILFSVAWNKTHRGQVLAALREFESVNLRVAGVALAQIDPSGMRRYGYGGKYGAYSAYGKHYYDAS